jgi:hypothetical protein
MRPSPITCVLNALTHLTLLDFFLIRIVEGGVHTGSIRHVGH